MESIICCRDVTFYYDQQGERIPAIKNVNCDIHSGEFIAIIGSNGSGKSTLAKVFNALLIPDSGNVNVMGFNTHEKAHLWQVRQAVGMVFQNPDNQIVATIVEEDVAFGPENLGVPSLEIRQRVDQALEAVGMLAYKKHAPYLLSGGQKQRVAIAGVLAMQPKIIVLDEPTAMLDPIGRTEVLETIYKLNKEKGITVILITHHMQEVVQADRVLVMHQGEIALEGTPRKVFANPAMLKQYGLDAPAMTELAISLKQAGLAISPDILTVEEMVNILCQLKLKTSGMSIVKEVPSKLRH